MGVGYWSKINYSQGILYITYLGNKIFNFKLSLCLQEEEILKVSKNSGDSAQQLVYLNEQIQAKNR